MKESIWGYLIIVLGIVIISVLVLVQNLTTSSEEDYYLGREAMRSSMIDAVDYGNYQISNGRIVMSREKFVEVFLRRFAESVTPSKTYQIDFYQIYEYPPAATVRIRTNTGTTNVKDNSIDVNVDTIITAILVAGVGNDIKFMELKDSFNYAFLKEALGYYNSNEIFTSEGKELKTEYKKYDINGNNLIDLADLATIEYAIFGKYIRGDVNADGSLTTADAECITTPSCNNLDAKTKLLIGDIDSNGSLGEDDKNIIRSYLSGKRGTKFEVFNKGDVNKDGKVTFTDALLIRHYLNGINHETKDDGEVGYLDAGQINLADYNGDGIVNDTDISRIIDIMRGLLQ